MKQENFVRQNWNWADQSDSSFCLTKFSWLRWTKGRGRGELGSPGSYDPCVVPGGSGGQRDLATETCAVTQGVLKVHPLYVQGACT